MISIARPATRRTLLITPLLATGFGASAFLGASEHRGRVS